MLNSAWLYEAWSSVIVMATKGTSFIEDGNYLIFRPFFCQPWYISSCFIIVYVTGMLANLFMLVVIGKDPKICLRTRSSYLITNLIISDFVGAVMNTFRILHQISVDALRDSIFIHSFTHFSWTLTSNNTTFEV